MAAFFIWTRQQAGTVSARKTQQPPYREPVRSNASFR